MNPNRSQSSRPHHRPSQPVYHPLTFHRMGILIHHPPTHMLTNIRWSHAVVGTFFDHSPPNSSYVGNIINNHWETRDPILVLRTGPYFILECSNLSARDAILSLSTTIIDGKIITFRPTSGQQIPSSINFNMARIWVRIQELPWDYLNTEWTVRLLSHVGLVDAIDSEGPGLPQHAFFTSQVSCRHYQAFNSWMLFSSW